MRFLFIILPFLLSGCFMYNNLKQGVECSLDNSKCTEYESEDEIQTAQEPQKPLINYAEKARHLNNKRCNMYGFYKGTINYVKCMDAREGLYEVNTRLFEDEETAYNMLKEEYEEQENTCIRNGIGRKAKNFTACVISIEQRKLEVQTSSEPYRGFSCHTTTNRLGTQTFCN